MIKRFDITAPRCAFCANISNNRLRSYISRINYTAQVESVDNIVECKTVDFCDNLCAFVRNMVCIKCEQNIFLIAAGKRYERLRSVYSLLLKQIFVCSVAVDDNCLWQKICKLLAP